MPNGIAASYGSISDILAASQGEQVQRPKTIAIQSTSDGEEADSSSRPTIVAQTEAADAQRNTAARENQLGARALNALNL